MVDKIVKLLEGNYVKKEIKVEINVDDKLEVNADEFMLETIIRNLISNAIKYTYTGGKIKIYSSKKDNYTQISVEDNGTGINEANMKNLFRIENKYSVLGTNNEVGTGLGLILCKEFVEKHGGKIWAESEEKEWTRFSFTLKDL